MPGELIQSPWGLATVLAQHGPRDVPYLTPDEHRRWLAHATHLLQSASWEGARGVEVTDVMRHTIAAHAALLTAGFEPTTHPYRKVAAIVIHRGTIVTVDEGVGPDGLASDAPRYLAGQSGAHHDPLLIDWRTARREVAAPHRGQNVVYHEFAHKLDQLTGTADGMPPLADRAAEAAWQQTMGTNYRRIARRGADGLLRSYAGTNPAEFFAVTTEVFFTRPLELREQHPRVYAQLQGFYCQDPAARAARVAAI